MQERELIRYSEITMLALTAWREARGEGDQGMAAVMCSILNRVERPSWWGQDVLSVVGKKWQYSAMSAPGDPNLIKYPTPQNKEWLPALKLAACALDGIMHNPIPGADSYHDTSIAAPSWTKKARFVGQVGKLRFYDVDRDYEKETGT